MNSFSRDTLVVTAKGAVPISEIEVGDLVLAYNEEFGTTDYYPVIAVWEHVKDVVRHITLDGELIETTAKQRFYTLEYGWVDAQDL